jgi:phosphoserine phosphatase
MTNAPSEVTEAVLQCFRKNALEGRKEAIAVFDLDGTLIDGDIGEAVFAHLCNSGFPVSLTPEEYRVLLQIDKAQAYAECVRAMEGLSVDTILDATYRVMCSPERVLPFGTQCVPVPHPNLLMKELVRFSRFLGFKPYIISASNDWSVKAVAFDWFGIPAEQAFGIRTCVADGRLTDELCHPLTVEHGKAVLYERSISETAPLFVAADTITDIPLLRLCAPGGVACVVGENDELLRTAREVLPPTVQVFSIPSIGSSDLNLYRKVAG